MIQGLGFIDTSVFTANYLLRHKEKVDGGILRLRDLKDEDVEASDLAVLREWKSARALLTRLRVVAAPFFDGVTPELGRAWIEVLPPMSGTLWDAEIGDYAAAHHRTRTCLIPSPGAVSCSGMASSMLVVGMVNLIDHQLMCSEVNHGEHARVHLVCDLKAPESAVEATA